VLLKRHKKKLSEIHKETIKGSDYRRKSTGYASPKTKSRIQSPIKADGDWEIAGSGKKKLGNFSTRRSTASSSRGITSPKSLSRESSAEQESPSNNHRSNSSNKQTSETIAGPLRKTQIAIGGHSKYSVLEEGEESPLENHTNKKMERDIDEESPLSNGPKNDEDNVSPLSRETTEENDVDDKRTQKIQSLIKEFTMARDLGEATLCIEELKSKEYHFEIVVEGLKIYLEEKDEEKDQVMSLLTQLHGTHVLESKDFTKGVAKLMDSLEDECLDFPAMGKMLGHACGLLVMAKVFSAEELKPAIDRVANSSQPNQAQEFSTELHKTLE